MLRLVTNWHCFQQGLGQCLIVFASQAFVRCRWAYSWHMLLQEFDQRRSKNITSSNAIQVPSSILVVVMARHWRWMCHDEINSKTEAWAWKRSRDRVVWQRYWVAWARSQSNSWKSMSTWKTSRTNNSIAATFICSFEAGVTAAAGTRLALQWYK